MNYLHHHEINFFKNMAVLIISHEIWTAPDITSWNFCENILLFQTKQFWWCLLKIWVAPRITNWNFCKNIERSFDDVTWKTELSLFRGSHIYAEALCENSESLLAVHLFYKEFHLRWVKVPRSAFGFNEVLWKIQLNGDSALMIMADLFLNERNFDWKEFLKTDIK